MARVLLIDDEAPLLELLKKYLERLGHEVDSAASGEKALELFCADPKRYGLVLTDLTLPGMNGERTLAEMRRHRPRLKAIISSGYPYEPKSKDTVFLQKPFLPKMLAEEIEKLLKG